MNKLDELIQKLKHNNYSIYIDKYKQNKTERVRIFFNNGYGVSISLENSSYKLFDLAVLKGNESNYTISY